nr:hypothetical protein [Haliscomenobacter sp.]
MKPFLLPCIAFCLSISFGSAQPAAIEKSLLLFPLQDKHVHASSVVYLPNGDLLAVWFYGSGERSADDVKLMGARLGKGKTAWSDPFLMADTPNIPDCNPVLFESGKQTLFDLDRRASQQMGTINLEAAHFNGLPGKWPARVELAGQHFAQTRRYLCSGSRQKNEGTAGKPGGLGRVCAIIR